MGVDGADDRPKNLDRDDRLLCLKEFERGVGGKSSLEGVVGVDPDDENILEDSESLILWPGMVSSEEGEELRQLTVNLYDRIIIGA